MVESVQGPLEGVGPVVPDELPASSGDPLQWGLRRDTVDQGLKEAVPVERLDLRQGRLDVAAGARF